MAATARALYFTGPRALRIEEEPLRDPGPGEVAIEAHRLRHQRRHRAQRLPRPRPAVAQAHGPEDPPLPRRRRRLDLARPLRLRQRRPRHRRRRRTSTDLAPGDLVFAYVPHGTANIAPARAVVPLGPIADPALGIFFANVNTAYNGVLDARPALGSDVVVSGLGVIGQIVVRLLKRAGVRTLIAVDGIGPRRERARAGGATHVLDPRSDSVAEAVRDLTGGRGADIVIEVSGAAPALNEAIRTVGYNGTRRRDVLVRRQLRDPVALGRVPPQPSPGSSPRRSGR